ncbi:hypothetical protein MSPP1_001800 [Malassezia sp. CBS 17886]|nr:hypothetical protein MSPP1_001800 [Malassezia sp. CBS 17886]
MKILNEYMVLGVFGAIGGGVLAMKSRGTKDAKDHTAAVAPEAASADEAAFIKQFIAEAQQDESVSKSSK